MSEPIKSDELFFHATPDRELCTDGRPHLFKGWRVFDDGRGGERVCSRCGLGAMEHSLRYSES